MSLAVHKLTAPKRLSSLVKWELFPEFCRAPFTLLSGDGDERPIAMGQLVAMAYASGAVAVSQSADGGNTGNGALALADPAFTGAVKAGDYTVVCTTPGADATSKFRVEDPDGVQVGTATGGVAFAKHIKFTISGGGTDFVEGDKIVVSVAINTGDALNKVIAWNPAGLDGSERIWGLAIAPITAPDGVDASGGLAIRRDAILVNAEIAWPDGITDAQKQDAIVELEGMRLLVR